VAGYPYTGYLTVNLFAKGTPESMHEEYYTGTALPRLVHNSSSGETRLFYAANGPKDVYTRLWNGSAWDSAEQAYSGAATIEALAVATSPSGVWSVLLLDDADNLNLVETSGGVWGAADVLATDPANGLAGVGIAYDETGNCIVATERQGASPGVYSSVRAAGSSFGGFELAAATNGDEARCISTVMFNDRPTVLYYHPNAVPNMGKLQICEPGGGGWTCVTLPEQIHGDPLGVAMDHNGNIIVCGHELTGSPYDAVVAVLFAN
jgi:hypothetical protein